jgi:exodeoxyribonuclease VII small subunit
MTAMSPDKKFEDALRELEDIVDTLETGALPLEEALGAFEAGVALVKGLTEKLTEVEKRVEVLTRDQGGAFQLEQIIKDQDDEDE